MFGIFEQAIVFSYLALGALYTERIKLLNVSIEGISYLSIFLTSFLFIWDMEFLCRPFSLFLSAFCLDFFYLL